MAAMRSLTATVGSAGNHRGDDSRLPKAGNPLVLKRSRVVCHGALHGQTTPGMNREGQWGPRREARYRRETKEGARVHSWPFPLFSKASVFVRFVRHSLGQPDEAVCSE